MLSPVNQFVLLQGYLCLTGASRFKNSFILCILPSILFSIANSPAQCTLVTLCETIWCLVSKSCLVTETRFL